MDRSTTSRRFVASLTSDGKLFISATPTSYADIYDLMRGGEIQLGVVIPPEFEAKLNSGQRSPLQLITDGSDAITARNGLARFQQRTADFNRQVALAASGLGSSIIVQDQAWYNPSLKSTYSMVPGLIPIVLILPSLAIALAITRERELGSFETLITTPIRSVEYLLGKLIPYITFGLISAILATLVAILWFQVPLRGSALDLVLLTILYLFASLGESLFISGLLTSQGTAMRIILLIFFVPSFFLTGVTLPVDSGSGPGQLVSLFLPATFYVQITRGVFLKDMGVLQLANQSFYLAALGTVSFVMGLLTFRKQVD
jgi:ABC-2 type transport system permease protein